MSAIRAYRAAGLYGRRREAVRVCGGRAGGEGRMEERRKDRMGWWYTFWRPEGRGWRRVRGRRRRVGGMLKGVRRRIRGFDPSR